jgi:small subunit ribosomal protein S6
MALRAYELGVILNGDLDEPAAQERLKALTQQIVAAGGKVVGQPDWWGRRRMAYPIKKKWDGYYVFYNVLAEGGALDEFERTLRIADEIFRHMLLRLPDVEASRRGMTAAA